MNRRDAKKLAKKMVAETLGKMLDGGWPAEAVTIYQPRGLDALRVREWGDPETKRNYDRLLLGMRQIWARMMKDAMK